MHRSVDRHRNVRVRMRMRMWGRSGCHHGGRMMHRHRTRWHGVVISRDSILCMWVRVRHNLRMRMRMRVRMWVRVRVWVCMRSARRFDDLRMVVEVDWCRWGSVVYDGWRMWGELRVSARDGCGTL